MGRAPSLVADHGEEIIPILILLFTLGCLLLNKVLLVMHVLRDYFVYILYIHFGDACFSLDLYYHFVRRRMFPIGIVSWICQAFHFPSLFSVTYYLSHVEDGWIWMDVVMI